MSVPDAEQPTTIDNAKTTQINEIAMNGKIEVKDEEEIDQANPTTTYNSNHVSPAKKPSNSDTKDVTVKEQEKALEAQIQNMEKENEQLRNAKNAYDNSETISELEAKLAKKNMQMIELKKRSEEFSKLLQQIESGDYILKNELKLKYILKNDYDNLKSSLLEESNENNDLLISEFADFKKLVISKLQSIKKDSKQLESEHRGLQIRFNDERQQRTKLNKSHDVKTKKLNAEIKTFRSKYNDLKNENARHNQDTLKLEKQFQTEKNQIQQKIDKLISDKEHLNKQLDTQKALVVQVRKEKKEVRENNETYLRNEKQKISKQLDKEKVIKLELEQTVTVLQDRILKQNDLIKTYKSKNHSSDNELQKQSATATNALKEKKNAISKLQEKNKLCKTQQITIDACNSQIIELKSRFDNFRKENVVLHESLRKKSEKEKKFDEREQKLIKKEKQLIKKEEWLNKKLSDIKNKQRKPKHKNNYKNDSKMSNKDQESGSFFKNDPLIAVRNVLPWHWISIILFVVLMLAVASRNL